MIQKLKINDISCDIVVNHTSSKVAYMLYPAVAPLPSSWIEQNSLNFGISIAVPYIPANQWNNYLTPWPEPGETANSDPFLGKAPEFLSRMENELLPEIERVISAGDDIERDLIGVSLSGLFALWQWMSRPVFHSIACLSGSFWFPGFMQWFDSRLIPPKAGKAFFLLGKKEPHAWLKEYRSVGKNTEAIVEKLKSSSIATDFLWVPGDHFADPLGRAQLALKHLFS